eukprot:c11001_g1_i1.p1 GENE.c11001_g1_i1~~c11001_g1_i1.p1  ORF type:complete len:547 (+),score=94.86 c11001_g1_i1:2-1642(+)
MRLVLWLSSLRQRAGPLLPKQYTAIIQKAKATRDLVDVVADFDKHIGGPPDRIFLCAAAKTGSTIPNCPPIIPARFLDRIPVDQTDEATQRVAALVLHKAAEVRDPVAARLVFSRLPRPEPMAWSSLLQASSGDEVKMRAVLEDILVQMRCDVDTLTGKFLSLILKRTSTLHDADLMDRVWAWSAPVRHHLQTTTTPDPENHIALHHVQYILAMSRIGHLDKARAAWKEWIESPLGSSDQATGADILRAAMISAVASHGDAETAEQLYHSRPATYALPTTFYSDKSALISLLTAYSHAGLPARALQKLREAEAAGPVDVQVYTAAIDAFARAGDFEQAHTIIADMQAKGVSPNAITWTTILGPCRRYRNVSVAERAFEQIRQIGSPGDQAAAFVVLAEIYTAANRPELAEKLNEERLTLGLHKQRGEVNVTVDGEVFAFHVGAIPKKLADMADAIEAKLDDWTRLLSASGVSAESIMCRHSEKLALAFAVLRGQKDVTLRKNLRICSACHDASCALTSIEGIVIRHQDQSRVHIMRDGKCSCGNRY